MMKEKLNRTGNRIKILSITGSRIGSIGDLPELIIGETYIFSIDYSYNITAGQPVTVDFEILINTTDTYLSVYHSKQTRTLTGSGTGHADFTVTIPSGMQYENKQILATANVIRNIDNVLLDTYEENPIAIIVPPPAPITISNYAVTYYPDYLGYNNYITVIQEFDYSSTEATQIHLFNVLSNSNGDIQSDRIVDITAGSGHKRYVSNILNDGSLGFTDYYNNSGRAVKATLQSQIFYGSPPNGQVLAEKTFSDAIVLSPITISGVQPDTSGNYPPDDGQVLTILATLTNHDSRVARNIEVKFKIYETDTGNLVYDSGWSDNYLLAANHSHDFSTSYTVNKDDFSVTGTIAVDVEILVRSYYYHYLYNEYYCRECAHIYLSGVDVSITDISIS